MLLTLPGVLFLRRLWYQEYGNHNTCSNTSIWKKYDGSYKCPGSSESTLVFRHCSSGDRQHCCVGRTMSYPFCGLSVTNWDIVIHHSIFLLETCILSKQSIVADSLGRSRIDPLECSPSVGNYSNLPPVSPDIWDSSASGHLARRSGRHAISVPGQRCFFMRYSFSSDSRVLQKIRKDLPVMLLLIPCWPRHHWFSLLMQLARDSYWKLPHRGTYTGQGISDSYEYPEYESVLMIGFWFL